MNRTDSDVWSLGLPGGEMAKVSTIFDPGGAAEGPGHSTKNCQRKSTRILGSISLIQNAGV